MNRSALAGLLAAAALVVVAPGLAAAAPTASVPPSPLSAPQTPTAPAPTADQVPTTPSQTVGPYLHIGLPWSDGPFAVAEGTPGAVRLRGTVYDGAGAPVTDALVETWQAIARQVPGDAGTARPERARQQDRPAHACRDQTVLPGACEGGVVARQDI